MAQVAETCDICFSRVGVGRFGSRVTFTSAGRVLAELANLPVLAVGSDVAPRLGMKAQSRTRSATPRLGSLHYEAVSQSHLVNESRNEATETAGNGATGRGCHPIGSSCCAFRRGARLMRQPPAVGTRWWGMLTPAKRAHPPGGACANPCLPRGTSCCRPNTASHARRPTCPGVPRGATTNLRPSAPPTPGD